MNTRRTGDFNHVGLSMLDKIHYKSLQERVADFVPYFNRSLFRFAQERISNYNLSVAA